MHRIAVRSVDDGFIPLTKSFMAKRLNIMRYSHGEYDEEKVQPGKEYDVETGQGKWI